MHQENAHKNTKRTHTYDTRSDTNVSETKFIPDGIFFTRWQFSDTSTESCVRFIDNVSKLSGWENWF